MTHTISNLDLYMRIALGNILYAANDFRHRRNTGKGLAWGLDGCSDYTGAVGSRKIPGRDGREQEKASAGASRGTPSGNR